MAGFQLLDPWGSVPAPLGSGVAGIPIGGGDMDVNSVLAPPVAGADWMGTAAKVAGGMLGGSKDGGDSGAYQQSEVSVDNSGWNVNFGGGSIDSARAQSGIETLALWVGLAVGILTLVKVMKNG